MVVVVIAIQYISSGQKKEQAKQEANHNAEQAKEAMAKVEAKKKAEMVESEAHRKFSELVTNISEESNGVFEMIAAGREVEHWRGFVYINKQSWSNMNEPEKKSLTESVGNDLKNAIVNSGWGKKEDTAFIDFYSVKNNSQSELESGRKMLEGYSIKR